MKFYFVIEAYNEVTNFNQFLAKKPLPGEINFKKLF